MQHRGMHPHHVRDRAIELLGRGMTLSEVSRRASVSRATLREWLANPVRVGASISCPRCSTVPLDRAAYAARLGYYLGDGCLSEAPRYFALRVSCDATYQRIIDDVTSSIVRVRPGCRVFLVSAPGVVVVQSHWRHWSCLFPQHGPGRKHERPIILEPWQEEIVEAHPGDFLRGLFHSDGSRVRHPRPLPPASPRHQPATAGRRTIAGSGNATARQRKFNGAGRPARAR